MKSPFSMHRVLARGTVSDARRGASALANAGIERAANQFWFTPQGPGP